MNNIDELMKKILRLMKTRLKYKKIMRIEKSVTDKYSVLIDHFDRKIVLNDYKNIINSLISSVADNSIVDLFNFTKKIIVELIEKFDALILMTRTQTRSINQNNQQIKNRSQSSDKQIFYDDQKSNDRQYKEKNSCPYCDKKKTHDKRRNYSKFVLRFD